MYPKILRWRDEDFCLNKTKSQMNVNIHLRRMFSWSGEGALKGTLYYSLKPINIQIVMA